MLTSTGHKKASAFAEAFLRIGCLALRANARHFLGVHPLQWPQRWGR